MESVPFINRRRIEPRGAPKVVKPLSLTLVRVGSAGRIYSLHF